MTELRTTSCVVGDDPPRQPAPERIEAIVDLYVKAIVDPKRERI
jgi:hypothetical protein